LNISRLGHTSAFNSSTGGILGSLTNSLSGELDSLVNDLSTDIANALNLSDFYSVHVMDYCQGDYSPNATARRPKENVTSCSSRTALFHFNPSQVIQDALPDGITLDDIQWPSAITNAEKDVKIASQVMAIFYIIGTAMAGLAMIGALLGIFINSRLSAFFNFVLDIVSRRHSVRDAAPCADILPQLAFLTIGVASAVATALMAKATSAINQYGKEIGIASSKGDTFLAMTWTATGVMLLASLMSVAQCGAGRPQKRKEDDEKPY